MVCPPSINSNGTGYRWVVDLNNALDSFSSCFLFFLYRESQNGHVPLVTRSHKYFSEGNP